MRVEIPHEKGHFDGGIFAKVGLQQLAVVRPFPKLPWTFALRMKLFESVPSHYDNHVHTRTKLLFFLLSPQFLSKRVINLWNALDHDTVSASTVSGFKSKLEKERTKKIDGRVHKVIAAVPRCCFQQLERPYL